MSGSELHIGAVRPYLRQLLAVPPPAEHVITGLQVGGHVHAVHETPRPPEAVAASVWAPLIAAVPGL